LGKTSLGCYSSPLCIIIIQPDAGLRTRIKLFVRPFEDPKG
jgi:hypothetical protein